MLTLPRYTLWLTSLFLVVIFFSVLGRSGILEPIQNLVLYSSSPISKGLNKGSAPLIGFFKDIGQANDLRKENTQLKQENEQLRNQVTELTIVKNRVFELEQALNIRIANLETAYLTANVIGFIQLPFRSELSINLGSIDGIKAGNIVLSPQGSLVGRVTSVKKNYAFVRLVTDSRSRVASQILGGTTTGILSGKATRELNFMLVIGKIEKGDTLITSGLGGLYPADIPIGKVKEVNSNAQKTFPQVVVEPFIQITNLRTVLINTNFLAILPELSQ
jgi:rod shape-determining protein MreC